MYSKFQSRPIAWTYDIDEMKIEIRQGGLRMVLVMRTSLPQDRHWPTAAADRRQNSAHRNRRHSAGIRQKAL